MSVYFAQVGPFIKIGYSTDPERRVRRLFKSATRYGAPEGTPTDLASRHLIRAIDGDKDTEALIHQALVDFSLGNEWYVDESEIRRFIATVETADRYEPVWRPAGPAYAPAEFTAEERAQLNAALQDWFTAPSPLTPASASPGRGGT